MAQHIVLVVCRIRVVVVSSCIERILHKLTCHSPPLSYNDHLQYAQIQTHSLSLSLLLALAHMVAS